MKTVWAKKKRKCAWKNLRKKGKKKVAKDVHEKGKKIERVKKKKPTTPAVPRRSPIQVLSRPDTA